VAPFDLDLEASHAKHRILSDASHGSLHILRTAKLAQDDDQASLSNLYLIDSKDIMWYY